MKHILDNPVWNALISGNKSLANGSDTAKYFLPEVSPFAGVQENTPANLTALYQTIPFDRPIVLISAAPLTIPDSWNVIDRIDGFQMLFTRQAQPLPDKPEIITLTAQHVPQMLALTRLTNPGPFADRTIDFGFYQGIFSGNQLVAMAGQRMHAFTFAEISAVCTHPDHTGKGYARQLVLSQIQRIQAAAGVPYLHVRSDNAGAIRVYEALGFEIRSTIFFYVLQKSGC